MTLYLVGKSLESKLVFASDGLSVDTKGHILSNNTSKIFVLDRNIVMCTSGLASIGNLFYKIVKSELESQSGKDHDDSYYTKFHETMYGNEGKEVLLRLATDSEKKWKQHHSNELDIETTVDLYSILDGQPHYTGIHLHYHRGELVADGISFRNFPHITGGVGRHHANDILLENILSESNHPFSSSTLMGLYFYILEETSRRHAIVGGTYFCGELSPNQGYSAVQDEDILEVDLGALERRQYFERQELMCDPEKFRSKIAPISETVISLGDLDSLVRIAETRLDIFAEQEKKDFRYPHISAFLIKTALEMEEAHLNTEPNRVKFQDGRIVPLSLCGQACMYLQEDELAKQYFNEAINVKISDLNSQQAIGSVRAIRGLYRYGEITSEMFELFANRMISEGILTKEQLIKIK